MFSSGYSRTQSLTSEWPKDEVASSFLSGLRSEPQNNSFVEHNYIICEIPSSDLVWASIV